MTHKTRQRGASPLAQPSFSHFDHTPGSARASTQGVNTGFREWLRKITHGEQSAAKQDCEQVRLEQVRTLLQSMLSAHLAGMSSRDLKLYLRVISTSRMATVRELRFECFDLMCRKISEPVAVGKLGEMDALLG